MIGVASAMGLGLGLGQRGNASVAFNPATNFAAGAKGAWFDIADASTLYSDRAGTTPASVNGVVGKIMDKSGRGNHLTATTDASRGTLRQSGDLYWIELTAGTTSYDMASGRTWEAASDVFFAYRNVGRASWVMMSDTSAGSNFMGVTTSGSGSPSSAGFGTIVDEVDGVTVTSTRGALYTAMGDGVDRVEGVLGAALSPLGTANLGGYTGFELGGRFYGLIISTANVNRAANRTYMAALQGRLL